MITSGGSPQRGFTLIELVIGLMVVALLAGIGVPMFREFILDQRLRAVTTDLRIALMTARSEAVKRNRNVDLLPSDDGWSAGWRIPSPTAGDPDILVHGLTGDVTITTAVVGVEFNPAGRAAAQAEFEVGVGSVSDGKKTCMTVALDGRADTAEGACPE